MTNRIDAALARLREQNRAALVTYLSAGDPNLAATVDLVKALEAAGADIVELGIPFSDPLADGVVNQLAAQRALEAGTTVRGVIGALRAIRETSSIPLVIYTYLNPAYIYGFDRFHADLAAAGADGILILDLPPEEAAANRELAASHALKAIRLIAPTTPPERIASITEAAEGFVYYVSREGVTGEQQQLSQSIAGQVAEIRRHTTLPVAVGFGISTPAQAAQVAREADGVVIGSAIVRKIGESGGRSDLCARVAEFVAPLARAVHEARGVPA